MKPPGPTALALADRIAGHLADPTSQAPGMLEQLQHPQSLAIGAVGIAMLHVERAASRHGAWTTAHAWLRAATSAGSYGGQHASLFHGVPALAFVIRAAAESSGNYRQALATLDQATAAATGARLTSAHDRIDRGQRPALAEFDLLRGLTGLGAYHLQRDPGHDLTAAVMSYLVRLTEPLPGDIDGLPGWWTDHGPNGQNPEAYPGGHGNLGLAHGVSGALALLSLGLRQGCQVQGQVNAITRICAWIDTWRQDDTAGTWWPRTVTLDEARTGNTRQTDPYQPSWCYGTPGIA